MACNLLIEHAKTFIVDLRPKEKTVVENLISELEITGLTVEEVKDTGEILLQTLVHLAGELAAACEASKGLVEKLRRFEGAEAWCSERETTKGLHEKVRRKLLNFETGQACTQRAIAMAAQK
jgi:hypothetical protein